MRLVIDTNQLQSPGFRNYLQRSPLNFAVFPDYVSMEGWYDERRTKVR